MEMRNSRPKASNHSHGYADWYDNAMMNLPCHIIFEIWSRLPIESVLRCRSVCKLWYVLGHDSTFIDLHLSKSMKRPPRLVLAPSTRDSDFKSSSLLMVNGEEGHSKIGQIPLRGFELQGSSFEIVGSCNGFLCISARYGLSPICLCNPITGEHMMLPISLGLPAPTGDLGFHIFSFGFGFDSFRSKYKVVRVCETYGEIITVGESEWRKLDFPRNERSYYGIHHVLLDGILYWIWCTEKSHLNNNDNRECILALDIDSEDFWTIECPPPRESRGRSTLIQTDGSLAIIDYEGYLYENKSVDIWLLKGSKTMGFSFDVTTYDIPDPHSPPQVWLVFKVMAKLGRDTFLLESLSRRVELKGTPSEFESSLVLYSTEKKQYLSDLGTWKAFDLQGYWMVPTLKSLNAAIDTSLIINGIICSLSDKQRCLDSLGIWKSPTTVTYSLCKFNVLFC